MSYSSDDNQDFNQNTETVSNITDSGNFAGKEKTINDVQDFVHSKETLKNTLVGFLVSYSRTDIGEYWALSEGRNTIGSSEKCDIKLSEKNVSAHHATIAARRSGNDKRMMFIISDENSATGVIVNGKDIETEKCECKNFDKIRIGGYELLLIVTIDKVVNAPAV